MPLNPGVRVGPYEVVSPLGAGGMGEVYRARDTRLNRDVARKVLPELFAFDSDRLARFHREAQVLASLSHPNIAAIHGLEDSDGVRALVLEFVGGETLAGRIRRTRIPLDEVLSIAKQIADALAAAHAQGIIHRDLKPANIKLTPDGVVKVLDFGLAKLVDPLSIAGSNRAHGLSESPTLTSPALVTGVGVLLGTAAYMSPEQVKGKPADKRSDVWAFGCVLDEMLTGELLYQGDTVSETVAAVLKDSPDLNRVPKQFRRLLRSCLHKDPAQRLHDIADWKLLVDDEESAVPPRSDTRQRWLWPAVAALLVAGIVTIGVVLLRQRSPVLQELRSQIPQPDGLTFNAGTQATISPDGHWFAFPALGPDNISRMLRPLSRFPRRSRAAGFGRDHRPLTATVLVLRQSVCRLWRGRKVEEIRGDRHSCSDDRGERASVRAGRELESGRGRLYARNNGHLEQVSSIGGAPSAVTVLAAGERAHRWPQFLPDGRRFLYLRATASPEKAGIMSDHSMRSRKNRACSRCC